MCVEQKENMGRYYKNENGKAKARKKILEYWPSSNTTERPPNHDKDNCPDIIYVDFLQVLRSEKNEAYVPETTFDSPEEDETLKIPEKITFANLVVILTKMVYRILKVSGVYNYWKLGGQKQITIVIGVDKHKYVNPARGIIHEKRYDANTERPECPQLDINAKMPDNWQELLDPVTGQRDQMISFLCFWMAMKMKSEDFRKSFRGKLRIIIDGHCITNEDAQIYALEQTSDCETTPLVINIEPRSSSVGWAPEFKNTIGESDYLLYFYLKTMSQGKKVVYADCYARDSDMVFLSVLFTDAQRDATNKDLYMINVMKERIRSRSSWISIPVLIDLIQQDKNLATLTVSTRPASQLMVCILAAGSDYTENHFYVPHHRFIDSYLENVPKIGPLVLFNDGAMELQGWQYTQMICHTYVCTRGVVVGTGSKAKEVDYTFVCKELEKKNIHRNKSIPTKDDMVWSAAQLVYYLLMISKLGESDVDRMQGVDMGKYYYETINKELGFEYGNVRRKIDLIGFEENQPKKKRKTKTFEPPSL